MKKFRTDKGSKEERDERERAIARHIQAQRDRAAFAAANPEAAKALLVKPSTVRPHMTQAQKAATIGPGCNVLSASGSTIDPQRQKLWVIMARKDIPRAAKMHAVGRKNMLRNVSVAAAVCAKEIRKRAIESKRTAKETNARAKKIMREMLQFWRKQEREERGPRSRKPGGTCRAFDYYAGLATLLRI